MPIQFAQPNAMNLPGLHQAAQQAQWNSLRMEGEQQRQQGIDENTKYDNTLWLAAATKLGMDMDPKMARAQFPRFWEEGIRRGLWGAEGMRSPDGETITLEEIMAQDDATFMGGFKHLHESARMGMAGGRPGGQQDLTAAQRNRRERDALVAQYGENSPQVYAFDMYVRSPKITDIGGVPTMFGAGGDRPLSTFEDEMRAAEDLARARAEGTNSVVPAKDRVDIFRKYPRMQAARRDLQNALDASFALDRRNFGKGGPMQGWLQITREGQQFQQAVEAMFSHIQALIRVPGVGAQSDWEGRIAQAPLPNLNMYPETRAQAFQTYFDLIDDLEAALAAVGGGDTSALTVTPEPITPPSEYTNTIRYDAQGNRIR